MKFVLPAKSDMTWHLDIESEDPVHIRGAYQVNQGQETDREYLRVNCIILDP